MELTSGDTITIPVNSYHRARRNDGPFEIEEIHFTYEKTAPTVTITGGDVVFVDDTLTSFLDSPICASGGCFLLTDNGDDTYDLSISTYGTDASTLPDDLELTVTVTDASGEELYSATDTVEFDDEITAVFANEVDFSADPIGLDLSGKVSLLGAADKKGKQETLAKGKFYASFSRDGDGDLTLAGADKDAVQAKGDIVIGSEPIAVETTDTNKDGVLNGPALATYRTGNHRGGIFTSQIVVFCRR